MPSRTDGTDVFDVNPPPWMKDLNPDAMQRASEIAAKLIDDGYSDEQAYEIALERLQENDDGGDEEDFLEEIPGNSIE